MATIEDESKTAGKPSPYDSRTVKASLLAALIFSFGASVFCLAAPQSNQYQVTGPVVSIDDAKIVVQKGKEKWEINRKPDTKITGATVDQIKPGTKVTIHYTMDAATVEVRADKPAKVAAAPKAPTATPAPKISGTTTAPKQ